MNNPADVGWAIEIRIVEIADNCATNDLTYLELVIRLSLKLNYKKNN